MTGILRGGGFGVGFWMGSVLVGKGGWGDGGMGRGREGSIVRIEEVR